MVIQAYAPTSNTEEAEVEWFYEDLQDLLELTPPKDVFFIHIQIWIPLMYMAIIIYFRIPVPYNEKDIFFGC